MREEVVDIKEVMERVQDDKELLVELFDIFQDDYTDKRRQITDLIAKKDHDELRNVAHSLKGASSNISAKNIYASFAKLEKMAEQKDLSAVGALLRHIDEGYKELQAFIVQYKKNERKF